MRAMHKRPLLVGLLPLALIAPADGTRAQAPADGRAAAAALAQAPFTSPPAGSADRAAQDEAKGATTAMGFGLKPGASGPGLRGWVQAEVARTFGDPEHWSKMRLRTELTAQGRISERVGWKLSGRFDYDAVYDVTNFYPPAVRHDQRLEVMARENYLDVNVGNWDFRLGRQHIVWGEIVGLFFADVVSAKDMREFLLPDFDVLRIPQWAARAEYAGAGFHAELLWVPYPSYDIIGQPGAEFFPVLPPAPPGFSRVFQGEARPARTLSNTNYGARLTALRNGWDVSAFYYRSMDSAPTFTRRVTAGPNPAFLFEARHNRISQVGSTLAKDFGMAVLKAEVVYTRGREFNVIRVSDPDGLAPQNTLDWIAGPEFTFGDSRLHVQYFERAFFDHDPDTLTKKREKGYTIYFTHELTNALEAQVLFVSSLERSDWMLRPKLVWRFEKNWRLVTGVDLLEGPPFGFFGRFANRDRAYAEVRYSF
jgi:hypothetical protein